MMIAILGQASDLVIGAGCTAMGVVGTVIVKKIVSKNVDKVMDHPGDKSCHVNAPVVYAHVNDRKIHLDPRNGYVSSTQCESTKNEIRTDMELHRSEAKDRADEAKKELKQNINHMETRFCNDFKRVHERIDQQGKDSVQSTQQILLAIQAIRRPEDG